MAAHGWSADEDDLSAEPSDGNVQGWLFEAEADEDEPEAADLEAGSQAYTWADKTATHERTPSFTGRPNQSINGERHRGEPAFGFRPRSCVS